MQAATRVLASNLADLNGAIALYRTQTGNSAASFGWEDIRQGNRDYFKGTVSAKFNGSSGIGCGTKSEMLAIEATNVGVGFWVTDEGSWNAKKLPANTSGRLYVWNGSNLGIEVYALYLPSFAKPVAKGIGTDSIITTATGALTGRCQAAQRSSFTSVKERSSASTVTSRPRFWRSRPGTVPIGPPTPDYVRPLAGGYWIDFCKAANSKSWQCRSADRVAWTGT